MSEEHQAVALVTGASRGIGRGIAERLAADGLAVAVNYFGNREAAQSVVRAIESRGGRATAVQADVGVDAERGRLVDETLAWAGRIDVLVNNAGITSPGRLDVLDATCDNWDRVLATNLKGPFFLSQRVARQMLGQPMFRESSAADEPDSGPVRGGRSAAAECLVDGGAQDARRGTIINISSVSAYAVSANRPDYCVAKAGLQMVTWLFASRLADEGIAVFEISPGIIASDMTQPVRDKYDGLIADGLTPIRRWGQPSDVARAVSTLVAGGLPFCTGQRIDIDGGFHLRRL